MQKKGFSRREFISLAGATGGAALLAACQGCCSGRRQWRQWMMPPPSR